MVDDAVSKVTYHINDSVELNLSYIPFIKHGGIFVPGDETLPLGTAVSLELQLPQKKEPMIIECQVVWVTPKNALHYVFPGIGLQFTGEEAEEVKKVIESQLDPDMEVGGYTFGVMMGND